MVVIVTIFHNSRLNFWKKTHIKRNFWRTLLALTNLETRRNSTADIYMYAPFNHVCSYNALIWGGVDDFADSVTFQLLTLSKTSQVGEIERTPSRSRKRSIYRADERYQQSRRSVPSQKLSEVVSSRERRRAERLERDQTIPEELDKEMTKHEPRVTAREKRRERLKVDAH